LFTKLARDNGITNCLPATYYLYYHHSAVTTFVVKSVATTNRWDHVTFHIYNANSVWSHIIPNQSMSSTLLRS